MQLTYPVDLPENNGLGLKGVALYLQAPVSGSVAKNLGNTISSV